MRIVPFVSAHLDEMADFGNQERLVRPHLGELKAAAYEDRGPAFTAFFDGEVVGCAGIVPLTAYRAYAWAFLAEQLQKGRFVAIHRAVLEFLAGQSYRRIDAHVAFRDHAGHRWARMLGFEREVFCRAWAMPDGSAVSEYVRWG